jgi:hypothetical protein
VNRTARWAIPAVLGVVGLGLAIPADVEDSWCAPQTGADGADGADERAAGAVGRRHPARRSTVPRIDG